MPITFRPGVIPNQGRPRIYLAPHLDVDAALTAPASANWDPAAAPFGMLLNDTWGDCAEAMALHAIQVWTANAGSKIVPGDADALAAYEQVTGFNPNAGQPGGNPTDQGTELQALFDYWRKTGLTVGGKTHQILAFAQVNHTSALEMEAAASIFGGVLVGVNLPKSAEDQTNAGQEWTVVNGSPILGGHAILCAKYDPASWTWITWGMEQPSTDAWAFTYVEEAWVAVTREWLEANGSAPSGVNLSTLGADFTAITGQPAPWVVTPPPTPTPAPGPPPFPGVLVAAVQSAAVDSQVATFLSRTHIGVAEDVANHLRAILAAPRS